MMSRRGEGEEGEGGRGRGRGSGRGKMRVMLGLTTMVASFFTPHLLSHISLCAKKSCMGSRAWE